MIALLYMINPLWEFIITPGLLIAAGGWYFNQLLA